MAMQDSQTVATDESSSLISSDKVEGTAVYDRILAIRMISLLARCDKSGGLFVRIG